MLESNLSLAWFGMEIRHFGTGLQKQSPEGSGWSLLSLPSPGLCAQPSPVHRENSIVKFEGDTAIISWITDNFQRSYCVAINNLAEFCTENNLLLKIKELIVDLRGRKGGKDTGTCLHQRSWGEARGSRFWESTSQRRFTYLAITAHIH